MLPKTSLQIIRDPISYNKDGFLRVQNYTLQTDTGKVFNTDVVDRKNIDAVVVVPYYQFNDRVHVYLRSSLRPAIALKEIRNVNLEEAKTKQLTKGVLLEFCAGLIEKNEEPIKAAQRELMEEIGFHVDLKELISLGFSSYPCVGICGEALHFFAVEVDPSTRKEPTLDGSVMEECGKVIELSLNDCFYALNHSGDLQDMKSEIILNRLEKYLNRKWMTENLND